MVSKFECFHLKATRIDKNFFQLPKKLTIISGEKNEGKGRIKEIQRGKQRF